MALIRSIVKKSNNETKYPFSIPSFQKLGILDLDHNIVILVGDNGSGKSTLLEIIASKLNLVRISSDLNYYD